LVGVSVLVGVGVLVGVSVLVGVWVGVGVGGLLNTAVKSAYGPKYRTLQYLIETLFNVLV